MEAALTMDKSRIRETCNRALCDCAFYRLHIRYVVFRSSQHRHVLTYLTDPTLSEHAPAKDYMNQSWHKGRC